MYVQAGVLAPEDVRDRIANEEEGDYSGIDADAVPEMDLENAINKEEAADPASNTA